MSRAFVFGLGDANVRDPSHSDFTPVHVDGGPGEPSTTPHGMAWEQACAELGWGRGLPPFRDGSCTVPVSYKPGKPSKAVAFGNEVKHGQVVKCGKKFNGFSCIVSRTFDKNRVALVTMMGRLNRATPFTYSLVWSEHLKEWAEKANLKCLAELVACKADGTELGHEAVGTVMAYLKNTPNPPADAPYLKVVLFAFRSGEWTESTAFSGDMLESLQEEEKLLKAMVLPGSREFSVVEGAYYECGIDQDDGSMCLVNLADASDRYESFELFIEAMDEKANLNVWEGHVISKQRVFSECPPGEGACVKDSYEVERDRFSFKRRPFVEELCLLCVPVEFVGGTNMYVLYSQENGLLVKCGLLDLKVCSYQIRAILGRLDVTNPDKPFQSFRKGVESKRFSDEYTRISRKRTNWFLSCGIIVYCKPTWVSRDRQLSGIHLVTRFDKTESFDPTGISDVGKVANSIPYVKMVNEGTEEVMAQIAALRARGGRPSDGAPDEDSFGEVVRGAAIDLPPGRTVDTWARRRPATTPREVRPPVPHAPSIGFSEVRRAADESIYKVAAEQAARRQSAAAASPARTPLRGSPPSGGIEKLPSPPVDMVRAPSRQLPDWIGSPSHKTGKRSRASAAAPAIPLSPVGASGGEVVDLTVTTPSPLGCGGLRKRAMYVKDVRSPPKVQPPAPVRPALALAPGQFIARTIGIAPASTEAARAVRTRQFSELPAEMQEGDYRKAHVVVSGGGSMLPGCLEGAVSAASVRQARDIVDAGTILGPSAPLPLPPPAPFVGPPQPPLPRSPSPQQSAVGDQGVGMRVLKRIFCMSTDRETQRYVRGLPDENKASRLEEADIVICELADVSAAEMTCPEHAVTVRDFDRALALIGTEVFLETPPDSPVPSQLLPSTRTPLPASAVKAPVSAATAAPEPPAAESVEASSPILVVSAVRPSLAPPVAVAVADPVAAALAEVDDLFAEENAADARARESARESEQRAAEAKAEEEARLASIALCDPKKAEKIRMLEARFNEEKQGYYWRDNGAQTMDGTYNGQWVPADPSNPPKHPPPSCDDPNGYPDPTSDDERSEMARIREDLRGANEKMRRALETIRARARETAEAKRDREEQELLALAMGKSASPPT